MQVKIKTIKVMQDKVKFHNNNNNNSNMSKIN